MRVNGALRLCFLLLGLCQACRARPPGGPYTTREVGEVPVSQLRMLSLGLAHLLQGLVENVEQLELRGKLVAAGLDEAAESLESLRKQSLQAGRTHRQARKDLQILTARGDGLWRAATDLQEELVDGQRERKAMQRRTNRIIQKVKSRTEPRSVKDIMDQQARRLATLTSEVSARDRMIDRRLRHINQLEKRGLQSVRSVMLRLLRFPPSIHRVAMVPGSADARHSLQGCANCSTVQALAGRTACLLVLSRSYATLRSRLS